MGTAYKDGVRTSVVLFCPEFIFYFFMWAVLSPNKNKVQMKTTIELINK